MSLLSLPEPPNPALNPHGWTLPLTDSMLTEESPYAPLDDPAESIAERLVMLAHLSFNSDVWGSHTGRAKRYWPAFGEHVEASTNNPDVAAWWCTLMSELPGVPLNSPMLLHEKNLLIHPTRLPVTQVEDAEVLMVLRNYALDLRDRARVWVKVRQEIRSAAQAELAAGAREEVSG